MYNKLGNPQRIIIARISEVMKCFFGLRGKSYCSVNRRKSFLYFSFKHNTIVRFC
jgi:hypothetical protein